MMSSASRNQIHAMKHMFGGGASNEVFMYLNIIGVTYFLFTLGVIFYTSVYIYIPHVYEHFPLDLDSRIYLAYFLLFEVLINYVCLITDRSYYDSRASSSLPSSTWAQCRDCQAPRPPRTHHCVSCKRCILKRDHHCFLSATCVGFRNQRYFIVFCFYCGVSCCYCVYLCWTYCTLVFGSPFSWGNWYHYLLPVAAVEWLFGYKNLAFLLHVSLLFLALTAAMAASGMGGLQCIFGLLGITTHEYSRGIMPDVSNTNIKENLHSIFGRWFPLYFLFPFPCLKQKGDGISFSGSQNKMT